jgi:nucleotide-binding universal stress UspA family protein
MLKSLLLVLESHNFEHGVVELGIRWATEFNALLVSLGIVDEAEVHPAEAVPIGAGQAKQEWDKARLHQRQVEVEGHLSTIALRCAEAQVAFKPLETIGCPAEDIMVEAQRFDLIVMPRERQRPNGTEEWTVGDTLKTILRSTPRPLVAVPDQLPSGNAVVIAYDGSLQAARTLFAFEATGISSQRPLHIISIHDDMVEASKRGNRAFEFLSSRGVRATLCAKASSNPAEQILNFSREVDAGLIVLGAYGRSRIHEFFLGSVTNSLLKSCPLPLFMFH